MTEIPARYSTTQQQIAFRADSEQARELLRYMRVRYLCEILGEQETNNENKRDDVQDAINHGQSERARNTLIARLAQATVVRIVCKMRGMMSCRGIQSCPSSQ